MLILKQKLDSFKVILDQGEQQVLSRSALLEEFAASCGQAAAMNWMRHFLLVPNFRGKRPYLVLVVANEAEPSTLTLKDLRAAVFLFEYCPFGIPTRLFCTDDLSGFRTVLAPASERHTAATLAADCLLKQRAQYILLSYDAAGHAIEGLQLQPAHNAEWAQRTRTAATSLSLEPTLEKTLAKLGKSTRFNMGYYRRRLVAEMPCEFIEDARGMLREDELDGLNQGSLNVVSNDEFRLRYKSACELPGGFLLGLRAKDGRWISLIGGWRQGRVAVLQWQMNTAGYERLSIGTVMRSFYLEHESRLGMETLVFYGGTPHLMHRSFVDHKVQDLFVRRPSLKAHLLMWAVKFADTRLKLRRNSQLLQALTSQDWAWQSTNVDNAPGSGMKRRQTL